MSLGEDLLKKYKKPKTVGERLLEQYGKTPVLKEQRLSDEEFMKGGEIVGRMPEVTVEAEKPKPKGVADVMVENIKRAGKISESIAKPVGKAAEFVGKVATPIGEAAVEKIGKPVTKTIYNVFGRLSDVEKGLEKSTEIAGKTASFISKMPFEMAKYYITTPQAFADWETRSELLDAMVKSTTSDERRVNALNYLREEQRQKTEGGVPAESRLITAPMEVFMFGKQAQSWWNKGWEKAWKGQMYKSGTWISKETSNTEIQSIIRGKKIQLMSRGFTKEQADILTHVDFNKQMAGESPMFIQNNTPYFLKNVTTLPNGNLKFNLYARYDLMPKFKPATIGQGLSVVGSQASPTNNTIVHKAFSQVKTVYPNLERELAVGVQRALPTAKNALVGGWLANGYIPPGDKAPDVTVNAIQQILQKAGVSELPQNIRSAFIKSYTKYINGHLIMGGKTKDIISNIKGLKEAFIDPSKATPADKPLWAMTKEELKKQVRRAIIDNTTGEVYLAKPNEKIHGQIFERLYYDEGMKELEGHDLEMGMFGPNEWIKRWSGKVVEGGVEETELPEFLGESKELRGVDDFTQFQRYVVERAMKDGLTDYIPQDILNSDPYLIKLAEKYKPETINPLHVEEPPLPETLQDDDIIVYRASKTPFSGEKMTGRGTDVTPSKKYAESYLTTPLTKLEKITISKNAKILNVSKDVPEEFFVKKGSNIYPRDGTGLALNRWAKKNGYDVIVYGGEQPRWVIINSTVVNPPLSAEPPEPTTPGQPPPAIGEAGFVRLTPVIDTYNKIHDWVFTHGEMRRVNPRFYDQLMRRFSRDNAAITKAITHTERALKNVRLTQAQRTAMTEAYESGKDTGIPGYKKLADLNQQIEGMKLKHKIITEPFQERMIRENEGYIAILKDMEQTPESIQRINELQDEINKLKEMRYLPHKKVVQRVIENKISEATGEQRKMLVDKLNQLTAKFRQRGGKLTLKEYVDAGILEPGDIDFVKLTTQNIEDYFRRRSTQDIYKAARQEGYIMPFSQRLMNEGWYRPKDIGVIAPELENQLIHPLFANAINEIGQIKRGVRGGVVRQFFGAVKVSQFIKPSIIWAYNGLQAIMRGMWLANPLKMGKLLGQAAVHVLSKTDKYNQLNTMNLYQFPAETPQSTKDEMVNMLVSQIDKNTPLWRKILEKITNTSFAKGDVSVSDVFFAPIRILSNMAWTGDNIQRTLSVLALEKMGYQTNDAVKIAARGHGAYSELSPQFKKTMGWLAFVHSFRVLMPMEITKVLTEPGRGIVENLASGKKIPPHEKQRWVKAIIGTLLIPVATELYVRSMGFKPDKTGWKWKKEVVDPETGEKREVVVAINNIINMPLKWYHRLSVYNPISPVPRPLQGLFNFVKWEVHPVYRMALDIHQNKRSMGDNEQVYDPNAPNLIRMAQIGEYLFEQSFRHIEAISKALAVGNMTRKEIDIESRAMDMALGKIGKFMFSKTSPLGIGYGYVRPNKQELGRIMLASLNKEYRKRTYNVITKYNDTPQREKMIERINEWKGRCLLWIEREYGLEGDVKYIEQSVPDISIGEKLLYKHGNQ